MVSIIQEWDRENKGDKHYRLFYQIHVMCEMPEPMQAEDLEDAKAKAKKSIQDIRDLGQDDITDCRNGYHSSIKEWEVVECAQDGSLYLKNNESDSYEWEDTDGLY